MAPNICVVVRSAGLGGSPVTAPNICVDDDFRGASPAGGAGGGFDPYVIVFEFAAVIGTRGSEGDGVAAAPGMRATAGGGGATSGAEGGFALNTCLHRVHWTGAPAGGSSRSSRTYVVPHFSHAICTAGAYPMHRQFAPLRDRAR